MRRIYAIKSLSALLLLTIFSFCGKKYDVETEEKIALGNILFGISEAEYQTEIQNFMSNHLDNGDSTRFMIDGYMYESVDPKFHDGKLYSLTIEGRPFGNYQTAFSQYLEIKSHLVDKYGHPLQDYSFPSKNSKGVSQMLANWAIGKKEVQLWGAVNPNFGRSDIRIYDRNAMSEVKKGEENAKKEAIEREEARRDSL
ncbi:hypothetical protein [Olivibacter sitiensis]|uniref:hypothetical protein n=1 Tax=Olivibacter sitiensis TaxID=376470 RepID=UPI0004881C85|nr:hypothetical protein [Olivibacter sitiensis]